MLAKISRHQLVLAGLGLSLLGLPYMACSGDATPAGEGSAELQAKLLGTWQGAAELEGETIPFSLTLDHAATKDAPERLSVVGSMASENPKLDGDVDGSFAVQADGRAALSLRLQDGTVLLGILTRDALKDGRVNGPAWSGGFGLWRP